MADTGEPLDKWKISYQLDPVTDVAQFGGYPPLGISFRIEAGTLLEIEHTVDVPEGGDALLVSYPGIQAICELLTFHWRLVDRVTIKGSRATYLG